MSIFCGIPFWITCSGELASQFYNQLQERETSEKRAAPIGITTESVARNLFINDYYYYQIFYKHLFIHQLNKSFVC